MSVTGQLDTRSIGGVASPRSRGRDGVEAGLE